MEEEARVSKKKERLRAELARLVAGLVESIFRAIRAASLEELGVASAPGAVAAQTSKGASRGGSGRKAAPVSSVRATRASVAPKASAASAASAASRASGPAIAEEVVPLSEEMVISSASPPSRGRAPGR